MRYFLYLLLYIPVQLFAYLITPILPVFACLRYGALDNANSYGMALRLPTWLSYFDTPDNSLDGDANWLANHPKCTYWNQVCWLYRNSLYGFKWNVISMSIEIQPSDRQVTGNLDIDYHKGIYGSFRILQFNGAWQYKSVKPFMGRVLVLNFGWLLDDVSQKRALFMFSPRIK